MNQLDLFGAAVATPHPPPPAVIAKARPAETIPTPPTLEWARILAQHADVSTRVMVHCSAIWTGLVLESLALGSAGQYFLMKDKTVRDALADPGRKARYVYMTPRDALALHARHPMVMTTKGTHSCTYRFAEPGEDAPTDLPLPSMTIGPEID